MLHYCSPYPTLHKINLHPSELTVSNSHGYVYFIHSKWDYGPTEWPWKFPSQIHFWMHGRVCVSLIRWGIKAIYALCEESSESRCESFENYSCCFFIMSSNEYNPLFAWCFLFQVLLWIFFSSGWHGMRSQFGGCIQYGSTKPLPDINTLLKPDRVD